MCQDCGCGDREVVPLEMQEKLLAGNDRIAAHNRAHFRDAGVVAVNLMGSPGSGKTRLLEATASLWHRSRRLAALSGDLDTDRDGERLRRAGIPARTITTGSACHLDARLVHHALDELPIAGVDFLFVENVGNLVCPAIYDLGQDANVVALSVTEGEDKPLKYPVMFRRADLVIVTKTDLVAHLDDFRLQELERALTQVAPSAKVIFTSARTSAGMNEWLAWLDALSRRSERAKAAPAAARRMHFP